ncbi:glutathione S-transferase C-terminal domain-containing protein [Actinoplanes sp. NPDC049681]|uniref:glutathione S-transferase C-terminal domain-containing protein n=1 Tax=Actinoplanes sp. NPDC049681 TaxID=3363905 RepID=UPI0037883839
MVKLSAATRLAGPVDVATYGEYRIPDTPGPLLRFTGRITADGEFTARPFRYHVYGGWFCPWSHRVAITRALAGLEDIVTMSFVDGERDGRGWAFREQYGPDPVNGFTLLREVYEATEENFDGHVCVPALWDRATSRLVSNDSRGIGIDLATRFGHLATPVIHTYPQRLRDGIEQLDGWLGPAVNHGVGAAGRPGPARDALLEAFEQLDGRLSRSRYLLGDEVTEADIRLWVTLVRYDVGPNAGRTINPGLHVYPHLWSYARDLYTIAAFRDTTDFAAFSRPGAVLPDWSAPADR